MSPPSPIPVSDPGRTEQYRWRDIRLGARESVPLMFSAAPWGFVFGLLAQPMLDFWQTFAMSAYVSSGTAQFVALERWSAQMSLPSLLLAVLAVNARYLLMGATLAPAFGRSSVLARCGTLFFLNDMSWALSMRRMGRNQIGIGYLLGASFSIYSAWVVSSIAGYFIPMPLSATAQWGLDFAVAAALIGLAGGSWAGRVSMLPWIVAASVGGLVHLTVSGSLYIVAGGLAGALAGALAAPSGGAGHSKAGSDQQ